METTRKKLSSNKKMLLSLLFLLVNIIIVIIVGVNEFKVSESEMSFSKAISIMWQQKGYLFLALACPFIMLLAEGFKFFLMIKVLSNKTMPGVSLKTAILGKYYDNITPLATGGQPFQIYYLKKHGIQTGVAGALPIISFFLSQLAFFVLSVFFFITKGSILDTVWLKVLAYVGLFFSIAMPLFLFVFSFFPLAFQKVINWVIKILTKMKIIRQPEVAKKKMEKIANDYSNSFKTISNSKWIFVVCFIISIIYQLALCSIPYFVIKAFGINASWGEMFAYCCFIYAAVSFIPTPGNSGATEFSFATIFKTYLSSGYMFWGMIFWRFISYYSLLIIGLILIIFQTILKSKSKKIKEDYTWEIPEENIDKST